MHYHFCPRCNFRMMASKPLCPTCGYKIPRKPKENKDSKQMPELTTQNLWSKFGKWNFNSPTSKKTESA